VLGPGRPFKPSVLLVGKDYRVGVSLNKSCFEIAYLGEHINLNAPVKCCPKHCHFGKTFPKKLPMSSKSSPNVKVSAQKRPNY
jgi:hypothetical protein